MISLKHKKTGKVIEYPNDEAKKIMDGKFSKAYVQVKVEPKEALKGVKKEKS